ncbi:MAG: 30S ribosomal protein S6e [Candidatus Micrarchaeota archaeon]|nr:30S ribosomal protein S6e [Candidatus Micrarchaeota archaeon]
MILNIGTKNGKTYQVDVPAEKESFLAGKRVNEEVDAGFIGLAGWTIKLTGGSDKSGVPMRHDVHGQRKEKILLSSGPGYKPDRKGARAKKTVRGDTYNQEIVQVNAVATAEGSVAIDTVAKKIEKKKE